MRRKKRWNISGSDNVVMDASGSTSDCRADNQ